MAPSPDNGVGAPVRGWSRVSLAFVLGFLGVAGTASALLAWVMHVRDQDFRRHHLRQVVYYASQIDSVLDHYQDRLKTGAEGAKEDNESCSSETLRSKTPVAALRDCQALLLQLSDGTSGSGRKAVVRLEDLLRGPKQALADTVAMRPFSDVVLADGGGRVIEGLCGGVHLDTVPVAAAPKEEDGNTQSGGSGSAAPSLDEEIEIEGERMVVFRRPVHLPSSLAHSAAGDPSERALALIGLVPARSLQLASVRVPPAYFLWAVLLLATGLLSLPLAKLWLQGAKSPFRRRDVAALAASAVLTALLTTCLFLSFVARDRLLHEIDRRGAHVAQDLARGIEPLITRSLSVLDHVSAIPDYVERASVLAPEQRLTRLLPMTQAEEEEAQRSLMCSDPSDQRCAYRDPRHAHVTLPGAPQTWRTLFTTDAKGKQTEKWFRGEAKTGLLDVSTRPYFRQAKEGEFDLPAPALDLQTRVRPRAALQVVRSVTRGELVLIAATARKSKKEFTGLLALQSLLHPWRHPVLPPGFQSAVVDRAGLIMLHSSNDAFQGRNLYELLDSPDELRAAIAARRTTSLSVAYLGEPTRVHMASLPGGWTALALAPTALADTPASQVLAMSTLAYAILATLVIGVAFLVYVGWLFYRGTVPGAESLCASPPRIRLFQPHADHSDLYARVGWSCLLGGLVASIASFVVAPWGVLMLCIGFGTVIVRRVLKGPEAWSTKAWLTPPRLMASNLPRAYSTACLGLISWFVAAPMTSLFVAAFEIRQEADARAEQAYLAERVAGIAQPCLFDGDTKALLGYCRDDAPKRGIAPEPPEPREQNGDEFSVGPLLADLNLFPSLLDVLPPFEHPALPGSGRFYRAVGGSPPQAEGRAAVPAPPAVHMLSNGYRPGALAVTVLGFALFIALTLLALHQSVARLFFLTLLTRLAERDARDELAPAGRNLLYLASASGAERAAAALKLTRLPAAVGTPLDDPCLRYFATDFTALPAGSPERENLKRAISEGRAVVLFSPHDWRKLEDAQIRAEWAVLLKNFPAPEPWFDTDASPWNTPAELITMWSETTPEEKNILGQLARFGYVAPHPEHEETLTGLAARRVLDPRTLTFANLSIAEFVCAKACGSELPAPEQTNESGTWSMVRVPLTTAVALLLACLGLSESELSAAGLALPGFLSLLPTLWRRLISTSA